MKREFQAKLLLYLESRKQEQGHTVIVIIAITFILGIATWVVLPLFGQPCKARQSEARNNIGAIVRAQQAYHLEKGLYTTDHIALGIGVKTQSVHYKYVMVGTFKGTAPIAVINVAVPIERGHKAYAGIVATGYSDPNNTASSEITSIGVVCESIKLSSSATPNYQLRAPITTNGNELDCVNNSTVTSFEGAGWKALGQ